MEAIVLAGGLGTRLRSVVSDKPKPMALIRNKPFLEYIFRFLKKNGIKKIVLAVGYKWWIIKDYFGENFEDLELIYCVEHEPLGTGGAIKRALQFIYNQEVYIVNGDTYFDIDLKELYLRGDSQLMMALKPLRNFDRYGSVTYDDKGFVTSFLEKGYREYGAINGGIYLASKNLFDTFILSEKFSFEEFIESHFRELHVTVKVFDKYFIDIGVPEDYKRAEEELEER